MKLGVGEILLKVIYCFEICRDWIFNQNFLHKVAKVEAYG